MPGQFDGKVALVTGAGSGIGRASALAFAEAGARVVVADLEAEGGEETVGMIEKVGAEAHFVHADVTRVPAVKALVGDTVATYGRLDFAHNNAGINGDVAPTADCSEENWDRVIAVNLTGVFLCMKYEIAQMLLQGGGAIVNTSSTMGVVARQNAPAYVASKHGVIGLTKAAALGYVRDGIRVNTVCPGNTHTPLLDRVLAGSPEVVEGLIAATPIGRLAEPAEIANAVIWLCSEASSYCTGHALVVDGCYTTP